MLAAPVLFITLYLAKAPILYHVIGFNIIFLASSIAIFMSSKNKKEPLVIKHLDIKDIEEEILNSLNNYNIKALIKKGDDIINYNEAAKNLASSKEINYEGAQMIKLDEEGSRKAYIFSPPATINPDEGLEFILRLSTPCGIICEDTKILHTNSEFEKLFDSSKEKSKLLDLISQDEDQQLKTLIKEAIQTEYTTPQKFQLKDSTKPFLLTLNKISKSKKNLFICQAIDISSLMTSEKENVHAQKMQAVGQLAGSIAHDFNNLLTAMIGFCDILLSMHNPIDQGFNEIMQIKQNANRAAELVKQLLAFSRKQVLSHTKVDLNEIVVELTSLIKRLLEDKVELKVECARHLHTVVSDITQYEQVVINLAVNARDAIKDDGTIFLRTYNMSIDSKFDESKYHAPLGYETIPHGEYVVTEVTDTGSGIDNEIITKIFEPFFSTKDHLSGTGLGLATVYGIVKQIGGYLRFKTKIGVGTSFFIYFPKLEDDDETTPKRIYRNPSEIDSVADLYNKIPDEKKGKILIVEDEEPIRMFEAHVLKTRGYEVVEMEEATSAITHITDQGEHIDLVITDVMMPGVTGPQMVEQVKDLHPHIKFLFTSGYAEDALSYFDKNEHNFLAKPFSLETLIGMVEKILKNDK